MMAILMQGLILSLAPEPVMTEVCCELPRIWDRVWRFNSDNGAEDYSGQAQW
jgi:hypothetical protein